MAYTFEILGVSSILSFFNHQQERLSHPNSSRVAYLAAYQCTLDALIGQVEQAHPHCGWDLDQAIQTVIHFWMTNMDTVHHWQKRLDDAGSENLLVTRLADINALKSEFDALLRSS